MAARDAFVAAQQRLLARFDVDATSRFVHVPVVDGPAHVLTSGTGPPVVLVPGFADPAVMWTPLVARLQGFTAIAVDRPCFGLSGCARHETATIRRLAVDYLDQVLDALGIERALIVANSLGSLWSIWFALDRPDRVAAMVHVGCPALALGTSAPLPMRLIGTPIGRLLLALMPPSAAQVERFARDIGGEDLSQLPELRDVLVEAQRLPGALPAMRELLRALVSPRGARPAVALTADQLSALRPPTLFVWGTEDVFGGPAVARDAARLVPGARLVMIPGGGHVPWIGHTDAVAAATVPFLRAQVPAA
ncbi:MAG: alpha/beta hydrolase [Vicinamibacterales bacterium]